MSSTSLLDTPDEMSMFANSVHPSFLSDNANRNLLFTPAALQEKMNRLTREGQRGPAVAGSMVAFAFTLNYIFGAGVLSLPYTISKAGVIGSAVFMIFTAFLSGMSMIWLTRTLPTICQRYAKYMPKICQRYVNNMFNQDILTPKFLCLQILEKVLK